MEYLSKKKIRQAIDESLFKGKVHHERNHMIIRILAGTGVRVNELVNITPNNLLIDQRQIVVRGKGNNIRNIEIPQSLMRLLNGYEKKNKIGKNKPYISLSTRQVRNVTKMIAKTNPHSFRHGYAIHLLRTTKNIRYVQKQLGHRSLRTTEIYLQFMEFDEEKEKLNGLYE